MSKHRRKYPVCTNCNFEFKQEQPDNFCPNCGQENHDLNVPFNHVALELLEGTIHYDSRFWVTIKYLLFYPGRLTNEFHRGRRIGYVPPIRLYVFISFVFFFLLSLRIARLENGSSTIAADVNATMGDTDSTAGTRTFHLQDSLAASPLKASITLSDSSQQGQNRFFTLPRKATQAQLDSALTGLGMENHNWATRGAVQQMANLVNLPKTEALLKGLKYWSMMMFVLMPVFALLLKLVFYKARRYYMEHLMFSIHLHSFFFLLFIIYMLLLYVVSSASLLGWFNLLGILYLFLGLKRVFKRNYFRTFFNMVMVLFLYAVTSVATLCLGLLANQAF